MYTDSSQNSQIHYDLNIPFMNLLRACIKSMQISTKTHSLICTFLAKRGLHKFVHPSSGQEYTNSYIFTTLRGTDVYNIQYAFLTLHFKDLLLGLCIFIIDMF